MKKRLQKLSLHRETLRSLTDPQLRLPQGGRTEDTCLLNQTGPCFPCMTHEFMTCEC